MLEDRLPKSIVKLSKLQQFYLYMNKISGKTLSVFGNISGLLLLNLGENHFEGTMPDSLANCTHLEEL
jgi:Leucine-rich repeat (LRR) protein